jgi:predicted DNA-binding transcriptional regulator AlpA
LMADYPASHTARVIDALQRGPRISPAQLAKDCGVTRRTVWMWVKVGRLPKPKQAGERRRYWEYEQVKAVLP